MSKHEIHIQELIGKVYFEIADWHNSVGDDAEENKTKLYGKSHKIINMVLSEVGLSLNNAPLENAPDDPEEDRLEKMEKQLKMLAEKIAKEDSGES